MSYQYPYIPGHSSMPTTPQTTYRWDDGDPHHQQQQQQEHRQQQQRPEQQVLQHPLQHQPEQNQDVYVPTTSTTTVQLQEHVPIVPTQDPRRPGSSHIVEGDERQLRLQHVSLPAILQPEHMRPMIDTSRVYHGATSASPPSGPPSAGPSSAFHSSIGPVRARISPVHTAAHPYRRPQSAAGVAIARSRREPEDAQSVRCSRQASSSGTLSIMPAPLATTPTATTPTGFPTAAKMISTINGLINPAYSSTGGNVVIRTDLHFDSETSVLTALCELPGRSKSDITVVLSTNSLNRVKQVVVTAKSSQDVASDGYVLRERRSGRVSRTFVVPSETKPDDITVELRDGLLSLKIRCPPPSLEDDSQEIVIR